MNDLFSNRFRARDGIERMIKILTIQRRGLKICHINAQSLRPKIEEFRYIFENSGVDVICVSETWFKPKFTDFSISLQGYNVIRADRNGYGGVAIYVTKGIAIKVINRIMRDVSVDIANRLEGQLEYLFLELSCERRKLLLGCVYRPNNRICMAEFMSNLESLTASYENVVITGDFNSNILVNPYLTDNMLTLGLCSPNTNNPSHFTNTSNTLIDLFFVSDISKVLLYDQLSASCFSRHDLIFMTYNFQLNVQEQLVRYRDFGNIDYSTLEVEFFRIDWSLLYNIISVDDQLSFLQCHLDYLYNLAVPLRTKVVNRYNKPW